MLCLPVSPASIAAAAAALRAGRLAIIATDTVYGVVADARVDEAVRALYAAKGKGADAPLQLLFAARDASLGRYAALSPPAARLIDALGPGGWTVITPAAPGWESPALAGGHTVGVRMPAAVVVASLVAALGAPLAASSANRHGEPSPRDCAAACASLGPACAIALDGGDVAGIDSTVVDCAAAEPRILREGAIDRQTVARILGLRDIPVLRSVRP